MDVNDVANDDGDHKREKSAKKSKRKIRDGRKGTSHKNIEDIIEDDQSPNKVSGTKEEPNYDLQQTQSETKRKKKEKDIEKSKLESKIDNEDIKDIVPIYEGKIGDKIKEDFNYMMLKYAEIFVNNDVLRKEWIASTQKREEDVLRLEAENRSLQRRINTLECDYNKVTDRRDEDEQVRKEILVGVKEDLINEKKDKQLLMNSLNQSQENEKNTKATFFNLFSTKDVDSEKIVSQQNLREKITQELEDVDMYKYRLLEKLIYVDNEGQLRQNIKDFNRRKQLTDDGITFYGNPKSLDHIYDLIMKIRKNSFPMNSQKRKTALEEICQFVQNKSVTFLRYFGFAEGVLSSQYSDDTEIIQISLHIQYFLSIDSIISKEIISAGGIKSVKEMLFVNDEIVRIEAQGVFMNLSKFDECRNDMTRKDIIVFLIMLEESILKGNIRVVYLIWKILQNVALDFGLSNQLISNGVIRLFTMSLNLFNSLKIEKVVQECQKSLSSHKDAVNLDTICGEDLINTLFELIKNVNMETTSQIIEILSELSSSKNTKRIFIENKSFQDILINIGLQANKDLRRITLNVLANLFSDQNDSVKRIASTRQTSFIFMTFNDNSTEIKLLSIRVIKTLLCAGIFDPHSEEDFVDEIIKNASFQSNMKIQNACIELVYVMCCSFVYLPFMIVNSNNLLKMIENALYRLHPYIFDNKNQKAFQDFNPIEVYKNNKEYFYVEEEDLITNLSELERIHEYGVMEEKKYEILKQVSEQQRAKVKEALYARRIHLGEAVEIDTMNLANLRSGVASEFTNMEQFEFRDNKLLNAELAHQVFKDQLSNDDRSVLKNQQLENNDKVVVDKQAVSENFKASRLLVKISTFQINCDLAYAKVMSFNFQAVYSILLDKSINNRDLDQMDTIFFFFANFYDILLLKNKRMCVEQLREQIRSFSEKFLARIIGILNREINKQVSNWNILSSACSLLQRLCTREETVKSLIGYDKLSEFLGTIIDKAISQKSKNQMSQLVFISGHLSIYQEMHKLFLKREFIAFLLSLLGDKDDNFFKNWDSAEDSPEFVSGGEGLGFLKKIMCDSNTIVFIVTLIMINLSKDRELPKILGSLPAENSMKPLIKMFLIDKNKVKGQISALCVDPDFQAKMASFIPVNFVLMANEVDSLLFEELRATIQKPTKAVYKKSPGYHTNVSKVIFNNLNMSDQKWRRMIKLAQITYNAEHPYHRKNLGFLDYESEFALREKLTVPDLLLEKDEDNDGQGQRQQKFYIDGDEEEEIIMPEDSMSGILRSDGQKIDDDKKEKRRKSINFDSDDSKNGDKEQDQLDEDDKYQPQNFKDFYGDNNILSEELMYKADKKKNKNLDAKGLLQDEVTRIGKASKLGNRDEADIITEEKKIKESKNKFNFPSRTNEDKEIENKEFEAYTHDKEQQKAQEEEEEVENAEAQNIVFMMNAVKAVKKLNNGKVDVMEPMESKVENNGVYESKLRSKLTVQASKLKEQNLANSKAKNGIEDSNDNLLDKKPRKMVRNVKKSKNFNESGEFEELQLNKLSSQRHTIKITLSEILLDTKI